MIPSRLGRILRTARNQRGVSLLEVLIAAAILVVVMYWLTQYYVQGRKHFDYEEQRRKATAVAQARLDEVRRWSYPYLMTLVDTTGATSVDTTMLVDGNTYTVNLFLTGGPNPGSATLRAVVVWDAALDYAPDNTFTRRDTVTTIVGRPFPGAS